MKTNISLYEGIAIGAGLFYWLDPGVGRRRRALLRDQFIHGFDLIGSVLSKASRDLNHRAHGFFIETVARLKDENIPDETLVERVRSKMGRSVSHPHAIHIAAHDGCVVVSGPILAHEVNSLIECIRSVRGVADIINRCDIKLDAGEIPSLQGKAYASEKPRWLSSPRLVSNSIFGALLGGTILGLVKKNLWISGVSAISLILFGRGFNDPRIAKRIYQRRSINAGLLGSQHIQ